MPPMRRIWVIFDSLRYDTYVAANTSLFNQNIGKPIKAMTYTNHTLTTFIDMVSYNRLPEPVVGERLFRKRFNYAQELRANGTKVHLVTDNVHLELANMPIKGIQKHFDTYKVFKRYYESGNELIKFANQLNLGKSYLLILWFGETHQPYNYGNTKTRDFVKIARLTPRYNQGRDVISKSHLDYLKQRQKEACEWLVKRSWNGFLVNHPNDSIVVTADHGESFGENHKYGHGCDIHEAQFLVPLVFRPQK